VTRGKRPGKRADTTRIKLVSGEGEREVDWNGLGDYSTPDLFKQTLPPVANPPQENFPKIFTIITLHGKQWRDVIFPF